MKFLLDTNICIYAIKGIHPILNERIRASRPEQLAISSISTGELLYGIEKSQHREKSQARLDVFLAEVDVMPFELSAARSYARVRAALETKGKPIGPLDMQIAGHALALGFTLVTHNTREFGRVSGLTCEDWVLKH